MAQTDRKPKTSITWLQTAISVLLALLVWQGAAMAVDSTLIFSSPLSVAKECVTMWREGAMVSDIFGTCFRITLGFLSAFLTGSVLAALAGRFSLVEVLLRPYMVTVRAVPVASFVILALFFLSSDKLSIFISFLIALPIVYTNLLTGIRSADRGLLEAAKVYKVSLLRRVKYIYLPAVRPYALAACRMAVGLSWKSGIAAEVIGIPAVSVGEALYYAKAYFDTDRLFAITLAVVLISMISEKLLTFVVNKTLDALTHK